LRSSRASGDNERIKQSFEGKIEGQIVIPECAQRVRAKRGPMTGSGADPESMAPLECREKWIPGSRLPNKIGAARQFCLDVAPRNDEG
jgi:hypothetical protein